MIHDRQFPVEPWSVSETALDLGVLAQSESLFALSNGHIGLRGNLDEGEPFGIPGTYLNSFYEQRPLPYAEAGYGYPEMGQTLIDVTNGKLIRLLVDDAPFDVRYGDLHEHHRRLDLVGDQFGLHDRPNRAVDRLHHVLDRGDRPLGQRDHPGGPDPDPAAGRRGPVDRAGQRAGPQVQRPGVRPEGAVPDVERLVIDQ